MLSFILKFAFVLIGVEHVIYTAGGPSFAVVPFRYQKQNQWAVVCGFGPVALRPTKAQAIWVRDEMEIKNSYALMVERDASQEMLSIAQ